MKPVLYQFPISHYCEKARWALEFKGIDYQVKNLVPGPHRQTLKKMAPNSHTPVYQCGEVIVQGSDQIIDYLERVHKHPPLTPSAPEESSMAHEWSRFADRNVGIPLRLLFYFHVLPKRMLATRLLTEDCPWWAKPLFAIAFPGIRAAMRKRMQIDAENAKRANNTLNAALHHIAKRIADRKYLVGNTFTRADLSVCALLAPVWRDIDDLPSELATIIGDMRSHQAVQWAHHTYLAHRHH